MHYKNFFSAAALVTLLSLSNSAFSDPAGLEEGDASYYVRLQYNGELLPFKTKIGEFSVKKSDAVDATLDPFKASFIGGGAEFGYKMEDFRVGVEGVYSQLNKNVDQDVKVEPEAADKLTAIAVLVNVNYDVAIIEDMPVTPYVSVGVGAAYINNPLKTAVADTATNGFGVAYQAKAGVSYAVTPEINLYAGARYFGSYGAKFDHTDKADGKITVLYSVIGAEAGVAFNF